MERSNELEDDGDVTLYKSSRQASHLTANDYYKNVNKKMEVELWERLRNYVKNAECGDALRKDFGKLPWHLFPYDGAEGVVKVLEFGAEKYAPRGWEQGMDYSRCYNSMMRHLVAWWNGEDLDPETGLNHMYHAACNALFLSTYIKRGLDEHDDRPIR